MKKTQIKKMYNKRKIKKIIFNNDNNSKNNVNKYNLY